MEKQGAENNAPQEKHSPVKEKWAELYF